MQHSCPDIFTDCWKINQVLSPNESVMAFSQAPGVCPMGVLFSLGSSGELTLLSPEAELESLAVTSQDLLRNTPPHRMH